MRRDGRKDRGSNLARGGLAALALGAVLMAACAGGGTSADRSSGATVDAGATADRSASQSLAGLKPNQALGVTRSVISTATLRVRVADRAKAASKAVDLTRQAGGTVFAQTADLQGTDDTTLTLKVPPARFQPMLRSLAALGKPLARHSEAEDVTEKVVDLEGRLATARASAARLRKLLEQAADVQGIVAIEGELAKREAEVESMEGELRVIRSQVAEATIELALTAKSDLKVNKDLPGVGTSLHDGWTALRNTVSALLVVLAFLLPFLLVLLPFGLLLRWWWRRRPARPVRPAAPGWMAGPPPPTVPPAGA